MLVNEIKTVPLWDYIRDSLSKRYIKNIITGEEENAYDILNIDRCYNLDVLERGGYEFKKAVTIPFATRGKYFGNVFEVKKKVRYIKKRKKVRQYFYEPIETIEKVKKNKYIKVLEPVYSIQKIGKTRYYTTQYQYKRRRKYYYINKKTIQNIKKYKYITVDDGYDKKIEETKKLKYIYKFKLYIPYFLFETYRLQDGEMIHELRIEPFYARREHAMPFGNMQPDRKTILYSTPTEIYEQGTYDNVIEYVKFQLEKSKPQGNLEYLRDLWLDYQTMSEEKKEYFKGNYYYDERIIEMLFFVDYDTQKDNLKIEVVN